MPVCLPSLSERQVRALFAPIPLGRGAWFVLADWRERPPTDHGSIRDANRRPVIVTWARGDTDMGNATRHHARAALGAALSVVLGLGGLPAQALAEAIEEVQAVEQGPDAGGALLETQAVDSGMLYSGTNGSCTWTVDAEGNMLMEGGTYGGNPTKSSNQWETTGATHDEVKQAIVTAAFARVNVSAYNALSCLFYQCESLRTIDLSGLRLIGDRVMMNGTLSMSSMFQGCTSLEEADLSGLDLSVVDDFSCLFYGCTSLRTVNLTGTNLRSTAYRRNMFYGCTSLESLTYDETWPLSFDTIPAATAENGKWFSTADGRWMTVGEIVVRSPKADTLLDHDPNPAPAKTDISSAQVSGVSGWTYDGTTHSIAPTVTLDGKTLSAGTDYALSGATAARDAGEYELVITGSGDYEGEVRVPYAVARKAVTVRADDKSKRQGDPDPQLTATVGGTLGSDMVSYSLSRTPGDGVGSYAITPSGQATQGNYVVSFRSGTLTVTAASPAKTSIAGATVTVESWTYDGATHGVTPTVTLGGKALAAGTDYTVSGATSAKDQGAYTVTVTGVGSYEGTATGTYVVSRRPATVTADDKSKRQGEADPALTATVTGTLGQDAISYSLSRAAGEAVGSYAITPSGQATQGNYVVTFRPGTLSVTAADESEEVARLRGELEQAKAARDSVQSAYDAAVEAARGAEDAAPAAARLAELTQAANAANAAKAQAENDLENAQGALEIAQGGLATAQANYQKAEADVTSANAAYQAALADKEALEADGAKREAIDAAQARVNEAKAALDAANAAKTQAKSAYDAKAADVTSIEELIVAQEKRVSQAQAALDNASGTVVDVLAGIDVDKGSLGFFQWMVREGHSDATCDYMTGNLLGTTYHSYNAITGAAKEREATSKSIIKYTELGAEGDATSLENMKAAVQWVHVANRYRQKFNDTYGLSESNPEAPDELGNPVRYLKSLVITDTAMAEAQIKANSAAKTGCRHAGGAFTNPENLAAYGNAWAYYLGEKGPFAMWYDDERNVWLRDNGLPYDEDAIVPKLNDDTVGHYATLTDDNWTSTGFAINTNAILEGYSVSLYEQNFTKESTDTIMLHGTSFTVDEFAELLDNYCALVDLHNAQSGGNSALEANLANEKAKLQGYKDALAEAKTELQSRLDAYQTADANATSADDAVKSAEANLTTVRANNPLSGLDADTVAANLASATTSRDAATNAAIDALAAVQSASGEVDAKTQDKAIAQGKVTEATGTANAANAELAAYQEAIKDLPDVEEAARLIAEREDAQRALAAAEAAYQAALGAYEGAVAANYDVSYAEATVQGWTYDGEEHAPQATLTLGGRQLAEGTDYRVASGSGATNAGTHELVLKGTGACTGTLRVTYEVARAKVAAPAAASRTYDGSEQVGVEAGDGYALSGTPRATAAGSYAVTATPDANHCWEDGSTLPRAVTWAIARKRVTPAVSLSRTGYVYDGTAHTPSVTVMDGLVQLPASAYDVVLPAASANAGPHTVRVTLKGNYEGSGEATFHVARATISVPMVTNRTYDGSEQVGVEAGDGYALSGTPRATNAGSYLVTATPDANHCWSDGTAGAWGVRWSIAPAAMSGVAIAPVTDQAWTGGAVTPRPTVKRGATALREGSDYTLSYRNNVNPGTATVIVTGKGNYSGSRTATFRIVEPSAPHVSYRTHVQRIGWQKFVSDGDMSGTSGRSFRLEAINIRLSDLPCSGGIEYRTHVQRIGWQGWRRDGKMAGTSGKSYRLEAIEIRLYGELAERYDVYYRVHCQRFGWMGWAKNGQRSGSAGYSRRLEGIQIVLVRKGEPAPDTNLKGIRQNVWRAFAQKGKK